MSEPKQETLEEWQARCREAEASVAATRSKRRAQKPARSDVVSAVDSETLAISVSADSGTLAISASRAAWNGRFAAAAARAELRRRAAEADEK